MPSRQHQASRNNIDELIEVVIIASDKVFPEILDNMYLSLQTSYAGNNGVRWLQQ